MVSHAIDPYHNLYFVKSTDNMDASIFGFKIPFLPDFLTDRNLFGEDQQQKLSELFNRFERFLIGLRKYKGTAFSLRFFSFPERGVIEIYLLCRIDSRGEEGKDYFQQIINSLDAHLSSYHIPHILLRTQTGTDGLPGIKDILSPFGDDSALVEIRQHERLVPLISVNGTAYVVHPYWQPNGLLIEPFEVMLRQTMPVVLSVYLEPTNISNEEYLSFASAAAKAQTYADISSQTYSDSSLTHRRDPGAEIVSKLYTAYLHQLQEPFIAFVQICSLSPDSAWSVARSYSSSVAFQSSDKTPSNVETALPTGTDVVYPKTTYDFSAAKEGFEKLSWVPWGEIMATETKERMPYLMGAKGAATIFRFPVAGKNGIPGIKVKQLTPGFERGVEIRNNQQGHIQIGKDHRGNEYCVNLMDLKRHTIITGFTGSGKTNTLLFLLNQLWNENQIPFLVIEAAKKEYRGLSVLPGFSDLLVFTLGDETTSPFRLNPFELLPGVRVEAHLSKLQICFNAALPQFGILPSIIAEAMENVYKAKGWKLTDISENEDTRLYPTMHELYTEVIQVTESRGYAGETYYNIRAAVAGRLGSLLRGSKGKMFGSQRSISAALLLSRPVILELNDLNEDDKALTMMFLITWLREYRELHITSQLQHVTVIEEAHNVLSNTQSVGNTEIAADTKAKAVSAFSNMLAEVRSLGEGIIIADQSPEKLAPDAMRNTNLQIAHQLRDVKDRESIARTMIMDDIQQEYLGKLHIGEAAVFMTGIERACIVQVPDFKKEVKFCESLTDGQVRKQMEVFHQNLLEDHYPFTGCKFCESPCQYYDSISQRMQNPNNCTDLKEAISLFESKPEIENWPKNWFAIADACVSIAKQAGYLNEFGATYCCLVQEINFLFTDHMVSSFKNAFHNVMISNDQSNIDGE